MMTFDYDESLSHEQARIHRVPVAGCACAPCRNEFIAIWSRSLLLYCGAPPTKPQEDTWR